MFGELPIGIALFEKRTFDDSHEAFHVSHFAGHFQMAAIRFDLNEAVTRGHVEGIGVFDSFVSHFRVDDIMRIGLFTLDYLSTK